MNDKISVILPTFNRASLLKKSIRSVFDQSYSNWELIIINNSSLDNTLEVIKKFKSKKIKVININNKGILAKSKNVGIQKSQGKWIAFLDDDDYWYPNKLEEVMLYERKYKPDFMFHPLHNKSDKKKLFNRIIYKSNHIPKKPVLLDLIKNGNYIAQSSVVVKKEILKKVNFLSEDNNNFGWEDFDTWIRCSMITDNFLNINKPLGYCWTGKGTISSLKQTLLNHKNFINQYRNLISDKFKLKPEKLWWVSYSILFYKYKFKKYKDTHFIFKEAYSSPLKIKIRIIFINLFIIVMKIFK